MKDEPKAACDAEIIARVIGGETEAYATLLNRYEHRVLSLVKRHVPENCVEETAQEVFIKAYKGLGGLENGSHFGKWISVIAVRTCCDCLRKRYRTKEVPVSSISGRHQDWLESALSDESGRRFHEAAQKDEARELLDWALDQIPPEDRMILNLVYMEGLSGSEAARLLGLSVVNVKVKSFRARKKLENIISNSMKKKF